MDFNSITIGATVKTNVIGGVVKECTVLRKKPAGETANWTTSQGYVVQLRVVGSKSRVYIVRTPDQCW